MHQIWQIHLHYGSVYFDLLAIALTLAVIAKNEYSTHFV